MLYSNIFVISANFVGLLTALHYECVVDDTEEMVTVAKLEMTDEKYLFIFKILCFVLICLSQCFCGTYLSLLFFRGRVECELRGVLLLQFKELLRKCYKGLPVVFIQFSKISKRKDILGGCEINLVYIADFL